MVESNVRLKYLIGTDSFVISDVLTGNTMTYSEGKWEMCNLSASIVLKEIKTLVEAVTTAADSVQWFQRPTPSYNDYLRIDHIGHFEWEMSFKGYNAKLASNVLTRARKFNESAAITRLQTAMHVILQCENQIRKPGVDVVRRISDARMLLWVHGGHTVVHTEESVQGLMMVNCLVDGKAYDCLQVSPSKSTGTCGLITLDGELVCEFPLDDSILTYYKSVEELFGEEVTDDVVT